MRPNPLAVSSGTRLPEALSFSDSSVRRDRNLHSHIVINGAGIAGLTAALCLARAGFSVEVHEKAEGFDALGAGIQISPNAYSVLDRIGLGRELRECASNPDGIIIHSARTGKTITTIPLGLDAIKRYGFPYLALHRADLQQLLFRSCNENDNIQLFFSSQVVDFEPHRNGITGQVSSNSTFTEQQAKAFILADGVHSALRTKRLGLAEPVFQKKIAWRALVPMSEVPEELKGNNTHLWLGNKAHAVAYPVRNADWLNVVAITPAENSDMAYNVSKQAIANRFRKWNAAFQALFDTRAGWTGWPINETPKPTMLHTGPVAIIGDAAHTMLPFAAQGAAMAIEDAGVLADCLGHTADTETALQRFEHARLNRVARVIDLARQNERIYHLGGMAALARNLVMKHTPPEKLLKRQDWVYGWRVDQGNDRR